MAKHARKVNSKHRARIFHSIQRQMLSTQDGAGMVVPFEVKSGTNTRSRSLQSFVSRYHPRHSFILSGKACSHSRQPDSPHMLPLYAAALWQNMLK